MAEVTGYDFMTDFSGSGTKIYTHGNFICSQLDYSDAAVEGLVKNISSDITGLMEDKYCKYLFEQVTIVT
jgi:hypothetical protein